jgi:LuxR family maltose regulon positive regulatory protein
MRPPTYHSEALRQLLVAQRIATLDELKRALSTTVGRTVFRKLKSLDYLSSYSHRGRYYTLREIVEFGADGIWSHGSVWFSRYGTLLATLEALVNQSPQGYFAEELARALHVEVQDALHQLTQQRKITRQWVSNRYVYTSSDTAVQQQQMLRYRATQTSHVVNDDSVVEVTPRELNATVVLTKLRPPFQTSNAVYRRRLANLLPEIRRKTLTVVEAPTGYGKSTLLSQWFNTLSGEGAAIGWISLDKTLDHLPVFLSYVVASLQVSRPAFGRRLANLLGTDAHASASLLAASFSNDLVDAEEAVFLFVDDFHLLSDSEVLGVLQTNLSNPSVNFHLVMATRHYPPFSVSGLRSKNSLAEIESDTICFDKEEVTEFLQLAGHKHLPESDIELLTVRTEGWVAGIQMASCYLPQKITDFYSFLEGAHHHLAEYFDDILGDQPKNTIEFLLKTSVLPRFNAELCDAVTGSGNAHEHLAVFRDRSLFMFSLDAERIWYRYHCLFSKFLQKRLLDQEPSLVPLLHARASNWFVQHGLFDDAFRHAIESKEINRAGKVLDQFGEYIYLTTLLHCRDKISQNIFLRYPRAYLNYALAMTVGWHFSEAEKLLQEVEEKIQTGKQKLWRKEKFSLPLNVLFQKMVLYHCMDNMPSLYTVLHEIAKQFPNNDASLMTARFATCSIYADRENYRMHNIDKMDAWAREIYEHERVSVGLAIHESVVGFTYFILGDTARAESSLTKAVQLAGPLEGKVSPMAAMSAFLLAGILYEKNEMQAARRLIESYSPYEEKQGIVDYLISFYLTKARLLMQQGKFEEAESILGQGRIAAQRFGFERLRLWVELEQLKLAIRANNIEFVQNYLAGAQGPLLDTALRPGNRTESRHEALALAWSRAQCAIGNHWEAIRVLNRWVAFAQMRGVLWSEVRLRIALSVAFAGYDREDAALRCLREAVKKAARPRFIRSFVDEGRVVEFLLCKLFSGANEAIGPVASFGMELIRTFAEQSAGSDAKLAPAFAAKELDRVPEQLNQRESEVLQFVALGLSNTEVGKRLGLTEASVKWYLQRLFDKLDARRRTMAVARARKFGLLPS